MIIIKDKGKYNTELTNSWPTEKQRAILQNNTILLVQQLYNLYVPYGAQKGL